MGIKGVRYPAEPLTTAEILRMMATESTKHSRGLRFRAAVVLMWRGQLRITELLSLTPPDLDPAAGTIRVRHGKGDRSRVVGLDPEAWGVVSAWLERRARLGLGDGQPVICRHSGKPMHPNGIRAALRRAALAAGVHRRVHPHGLRHSGAVEMAAEGVPLPVISAQLGHSSISTTHVYLDHLRPAEVIDAMRSRRWVVPSIPQPETAPQKRREWSIETDGVS